MPVGLNASLTRQSVDATIGDACQALNIAFDNVASAQVFLAGYQDADLIALGYTADEVAILKSSMADLSRLERVYHGDEATAAYDFTTFARQCFGTGFIAGR